MSIFEMRSMLEKEDYPKRRKEERGRLQLSNRTGNRAQHIFEPPNGEEPPYYWGGSFIGWELSDEEGIGKAEWRGIGEDERIF
jgi:hypothetical protein